MEKHGNHRLNLAMKVILLAVSCAHHVPPDAM